MDYIDWSKEYSKDAEDIDAVIKGLTKQKRNTKKVWEKKAISDKIRYYRALRREMESTALLLKRRGGVDDEL